MQGLKRRHVLIAAVAAPLAAQAEWLRHDVVVYCDPTLRPLLAALGARFGAVRVFAAPPRQMLALLSRATQDDVLITLAPVMQQAMGLGLAGMGRRALWGNRLVIASRHLSEPAAFSRDALMRLLGEGRFALPDASDASPVDGAEVMARLGAADGLAGRVVGAANTDDVAFMLRSGATELGLLHATDLAGDPALHEALPVPREAYDPILYDVALTKTAWSSRGQAFLAFLAGGEASGLARDAGLEIAA